MKHFTHTFRFLAREHRLLFMDPQTPGNLMDMLGGDNEAQPNANETNEGEVQPEAEVPQTTGDVIHSADQQHQKVTQDVGELEGAKQQIEETSSTVPQTADVAEPVASELGQVTNQALQARQQVQQPQLDASTFASTDVPQPTVQTPPINQPELSDTAFTDTATNTETGPDVTTDTIDDKEELPDETPEEITERLHSSIDAAAKERGLTSIFDKGAQTITILKDGISIGVAQLSFTPDQKLTSVSYTPTSLTIGGISVTSGPLAEGSAVADAFGFIVRQLPEKEVAKETPEKAKEAALKGVETAVEGAFTKEGVAVDVDTAAGTIVVKDKEGGAVATYKVTFDATGKPTEFTAEGGGALPVSVTDAADLAKKVTDAVRPLVEEKEEEKKTPAQLNEEIRTGLIPELTKRGLTATPDGDGKILIKKGDKVIGTASLTFSDDGAVLSCSYVGSDDIGTPRVPMAPGGDAITYIKENLPKIETEKHPKQTATLTSVKAALEGSSYTDKITVTEPSLSDDGRKGTMTITNKASGNTLTVTLSFADDGSVATYQVGSARPVLNPDADKVASGIVEVARSLAEDVEDPKEERTKALQGVETTVEGTFAGKGIKVDVVFDAESGLVTVNNKEGTKLIAFTVSFDAAGKPTEFTAEGGGALPVSVTDAADLATKVTEAVKPLVEEKEEEKEKTPEQKRKEFVETKLKAALEGMKGVTFSDMEVDGTNPEYGEVGFTAKLAGEMEKSFYYNISFNEKGEPTGVKKTDMGTMAETSLTIEGAVTEDSVTAAIKEDVRDTLGMEEDPEEKEKGVVEKLLKQLKTNLTVKTGYTVDHDLANGRLKLFDESGKNIATFLLVDALDDSMSVQQQLPASTEAALTFKDADIAGLTAHIQGKIDDLGFGKEKGKESPEKAKEAALKGVETAVEGAFTKEGVTVDVDTAAGTIVVKNKKGEAVVTYKVTFDAAGKPTEFTAEGGGALPVSVTDAADLATKVTEAVKPLVEEKEEEKEKTPEQKRKEFVETKLKAALEGMKGVTFSDMEVDGTNPEYGEVGFTAKLAGEMEKSFYYNISFNEKGEPTGVKKTDMGTMAETSLTIEGAVTEDSVTAAIKEDVRDTLGMEEEKEEDPEDKTETISIAGGNIEVPKSKAAEMKKLIANLADGVTLERVAAHPRVNVVIKKDGTQIADIHVGTWNRAGAYPPIESGITELIAKLKDNQKEEKEEDPDKGKEYTTKGGVKLENLTDTQIATIKKAEAAGVQILEYEGAASRSHQYAVIRSPSGKEVTVVAHWEDETGFNTKIVDAVQKAMKEKDEKKEKPELRKAREKAEATYTRWEGRLDDIKAQVESDDTADMGATLRNKAVKELKAVLKALKEAGADNDDATVKKLKGLVDKYTELKTKEEKEKLAKLPNIDDLKNQNAKYLKNLSKYAKAGDWNGYDKMVKWAMDKRAFQFHKFPKGSEIRNYALKSWRFFKGLHDRLSKDDPAPGTNPGTPGTGEPPLRNDPGDNPPSSPDTPAEGSERLRGSEHPSLRRGTMDRLGDASGNDAYKPYGEVLRSTPMANQERLNQYFINLNGKKIDLVKFPQYKHLGANPTLRDLHRSWGPKYRKLNADLNAVDAKNGQPAGTSWNEWVRAWKEGRPPKLSADALRVTSAFEAAVNADPLFLKICKDIDAILKGRDPAGSAEFDATGTTPEGRADSGGVDFGGESSESNNRISDAVSELESLLEELKGKTSLSEEDVKSFAERLQKVLDAINGDDEEMPDVTEDDESDEDDEDIDEDDEDIDEDDEDIDEDRDEKRERIDSEIADDLEDADFDLDALEDDYKDELTDIESDMEDIEDDITKLEDNIDKWEEKADRLRDKKKLSRSQKRQLEKLEDRIEEAEDEIADLEEDLDELEEEEDTAKDKVRALRRFSKRAKPFLRAVERIADDEIREDLQKLQLTPTGIRFEKQSGRDIRERSDLGKLIDKIFKSEPGEEISYKEAQKKLDKWLDKDSDRERDVDPDDDDKRAELTETILDDFEASALGKRPKKRDIKVVETRDGKFQVLVRKQLIIDGGADEGMVDDLTDAGDWEKKGTRLLSPEADTMEDLTDLIEDDLLALLP